MHRLTISVNTRKVCGPIVGMHFQLHKEILAAGLGHELLIQLATANCKDCQFKFQIQTRDAKVIRGESEYSLLSWT